MDEHKYTPSRWATDVIHSYHMHLPTADETWNVDVVDGYIVKWEDYNRPFGERHFEVYSTENGEEKYILWHGFVQTCDTNDEAGRLELWEVDGTSVHLRTALETKEYWRIAMMQKATHKQFYDDVVRCEKLVKGLLNKIK